MLAISLVVIHLHATNLVVQGVVAGHLLLPLLADLAPGDPCCMLVLPFSLQVGVSEAVYWVRHVYVCKSGLLVAVEAFGIGAGGYWRPIEEFHVAVVVHAGQELTVEVCRVERGLMGQMCGLGLCVYSSCSTPCALFFYVHGFSSTERLS